MIPFLWGIPLLLCFAAAGALVSCVNAIADGRYFDGVAFAGAFLLCCWGVYAIFKQRMRNRISRW
jgi:hypothetical protein